MENKPKQANRGEIFKNIEMQKYILFFIGNFLPDK